MKKIYTKRKKNKAFVSLFAVYFSAIVISILTALYILLIKQIQLMSIDMSSVQAFYMADSAFECVLYKEQKATSTASVFLPANSANFGSCIIGGDSRWTREPEAMNGIASSRMRISMETQTGSFCGEVIANKYITNTDKENTIKIYGQNRNCTAGADRIVERVIDFFY